MGAYFGYWRENQQACNTKVGEASYAVLWGLHFLHRLVYPFLYFCGFPILNLTKVLGLG